jgi:hypothetical protein
MPHACTTRSPSASNLRIIASGAAEPPTTMRQLGTRSRFCFSSCSRMPAQIVGTPAAQVTRSLSISSSSDPGSRCGPGMTSFEPAMIDAYGMPHALAWNIGTTGRIVSRWLMPMQSTIDTAIECSTVERCEYTTPFGLPVVPLV